MKLNAFVVVVDDLFSVIHATVTDLDYVLRLKIFLSLWSFGKCLSTRARNLCPILVLTLLLNGGVVPEYVVPLPVFSVVSRGWFVV